MRRLPSILKREEFWLIFLSLILLVFSFGPLVLNYLTPTPEQRVYLGSYGYPPDFWGKMVIFQEGRLGHWLFTHKTTTTIPTPAAIVPFEYLLLGQISRLFPLDPIIFFHLSRLVLSLIFLSVAYYLISLVFSQKVHRLIAYTLSLFATGFSNKGADFIENWSPLGIFQRSAYYPHYMLAFIFSLLAIIFLSQALEKKDLKKLLLAGLFGFLTSSVHAINTANFYLVLGFYSLFLLIINWRQKINFNRYGYKFFYLAIFFLISVLPIIYLHFLTRSYPWTLLMIGDRKFDFGHIFPKTFVIFAVGSSMFLSLYGSLIILRKKTDLALLLAPWSITYIIGYVWAAEIFSFGSQRFLQTPFFVILAILSTLALDKISSKLAGKKISAPTILIILSLVVLATGLPAVKMSLNINIDNFKWAGDLGYYSEPGNLAAIRWLGKNTQEKDIVLADKFNGSLIASLAGNYPYANDEINLFPDDRLRPLEATIIAFYQQLKSNAEAKKFLTDNKIRYVFWSNLERNVAKGKMPDYPFLTKVYQNNETIIFRVD